MIKTEEKTIDGVRYQVTQFPAMEAQRLLIHLPKMARMTDQLSEDELERLILRFLRGARIMEVNGGGFEGPEGRVLFNMHFAGKLASMWKLIEFVAEVNYADFFAESKQAATGGILKDLAAAGARIQTDAGSGPEPIQN